MVEISGFFLLNHSWISCIDARSWCLLIHIGWTSFLRNPQQKLEYCVRFHHHNSKNASKTWPFYSCHLTFASNEKRHQDVQLTGSSSQFIEKHIAIVTTVLEVHKLWIHLEVSSTGLYLPPWSDDWRHLKKSSRRFDEWCLKRIQPTKSVFLRCKRNTQSTFQLHDALTCAQRGLVLFLCICCCRHDVHFRALGQETAGRSSSKNKNFGSQVLEGSEIGAAPKGIL